MNFHLSGQKIRQKTCTKYLSVLLDEHLLLKDHININIYFLKTYIYIHIYSYIYKHTYISCCPHTFNLWAFSPTWAKPPHYSSMHKPPKRSWSMAFEKVKIVTLHRYCIYNKYFVNNLATLFFYQKSFINNNIVNKIKCIYWFNYKIVIGSQRKTSNT